LDDLNLGSTSGFKRVNALKKYIRGHEGNFGVDKTELTDMISALDNLVYSDNMGAELSNIESWIADSLKSDVKTSAVSSRLQKYNYGSQDLEGVISKVSAARGGDYHAANFYNALNSKRQ
jgi:hypothetical protein